MTYLPIHVKLPDDEATAFREMLEASEFEYDMSNRYRNNDEYAQFLRYLIREFELDE